jgi:hypothetical protein
LHPDVFRIVGTPLFHLWHDTRLAGPCYHASKKGVFNASDASADRFALAEE